MALSPHLRRVPELVARLVGTQGAEARERLLLDAVFALRAARAAALWRRVPSTSGARWLAVLERGPVDLLPPASAVVAALEGELGLELPRHARVLAPAERAGVALVLGDADDERCDVVESLLVLAALLEDGPDEGRGPVDGLPSILAG